MEAPDIHQDSPAWIFFVWCSFAIALGLMLFGIYYLPAEWWVKGYFGMGLFFIVGSTFTLSKTLRDQHESKRFVNRVVDAKTERILSEYEVSHPRLKP